MTKFTFVFSSLPVTLGVAVQQHYRVTQRRIRSAATSTISTAG
jgi:hypothetical protein